MKCYIGNARATMNFSYICGIILALQITVACANNTQPVTNTPPNSDLILEILQQIEPLPGLLPHIDPWSVSGDIVSAGSSTVFPLAERMAERFQDEGYLGNITVDSIGSGAGFERFCVSGDSDIANASRRIKDSEISACRSIGRDPVEFRVGTDALAVVVSSENEFLTNLSFAELALLFSTAESWDEINPAWPEESILRFSPGTDSGTFDYFVEAVFNKDNIPILNAGNIQFSEDDNVLVQGVLGSPFAIGYFGHAYYLENADNLTIISIDNVAAISANINNNSYPLARPLYIYSDRITMISKPQVAAYINFFLTYVNEEVGDVGYFPATAAVLDQSKAAWLDSSN